jgi:hypothetical protein
MNQINNNNNKIAAHVCHMTRNLEDFYSCYVPEDLYSCYLQENNKKKKTAE